MNNIVVNNIDLLNWKKLVKNIKEYYVSLINANINGDINQIRYFQNAILKAKQQEKLLLSSIITEKNHEIIFSFILNVDDKNMLTRMYKTFEPFVLEKDKYTGKLDLLNILEFQKKKNDFISLVKLENELNLNKIFILAYLNNILGNYSISKIYEIAFTYPDIEEEILSNIVYKTTIDKDNPNYEEIKHHLKNQMISIIIEESMAPNLSDDSKNTNFIELITFLTYLDDIDTLYEIENKISNMKKENNNNLLSAIKYAKSIMSISEKIRK